MNRKEIQLSLTNRWGAHLAVGNRVTIAHARGGYSDGVIQGFDTKSDYAKAYGPTVKLVSGGTCSIDDCRIPLGNPKAS